jgi:hypothetical protein
MAGTACFASEGVPGGHVPILRVRAHAREGEDCGGRQQACYHGHAMA